MFLKYVTETTELGARIFGMVHGVVFIVYCLVTVIVAVDQRWSVARTALGLDAAVPPFATLAFETYADRCGLIGADWLSREDSATAPQRAVCWLLVHLRLAVGLASSSPNRSEVRPEQSPPPPETDPLAVSPSMRHVRMSRLSHGPRWHRLIAKTICKAFLGLYGLLMDRSSITPNSAGLRALSHPVRLRMLGLLRTEGPATATSLARLLGLNTGATSYHLRQLAEHGFIEEETERGNARDRWWRAVHESTRMSTGDADPEAEAAYLQTVALTYGELLSRAAAERPFLPAAWDEAVTLSDWPLRLKPDAARRLLETLIEVIENTPDDPDADATYTIQLGAFPLPGQGLEE